MLKAILTDIEGTTSSIAFVKEVLFPYAREHLAEYVAAHAQESSVRELLEEANRLVGGGLDDAAVVAKMIDWIDTDQKVTPLKSLQGLIWEAGYRNGDFKGHMYDDAVCHLRAWHETGIQLYVYSSGSVWAQKLLFAHTEYGDLTPLFSGYFDTHVGPKKEQESYQKIAAAIGLPTQQVLFLSDIAAELDAARTAGMQTCQLVREEDVQVSPLHPHAERFDQISWSTERV